MEDLIAVRKRNRYMAVLDVCCITCSLALMLASLAFVELLVYLPLFWLMSVWLIAGVNVCAMRKINSATNSLESIGVYTSKTFMRVYTVLFFFCAVFSTLAATLTITNVGRNNKRIIAASMAFVIATNCVALALDLSTMAMYLNFNKMLLKRQFKTFEESLRSSHSRDLDMEIEQERQKAHRRHQLYREMAD